MTKSKFYVVWRGRETGIFEGWERCRQQVEGYPGAQFKGYPDWEQAHVAHQHSFWHEVNVQTEHAPALQGEELDRRSVCVNAKCDTNGTFYYWGFETDTGNTLFQSPEYRDGNINVAHFLALVHAISLLKKMDNDTRPIYSINQTAIKWIEKGSCRTTLCRTLNNTAVFDLLLRANRWLTNNAIPNRIIIWSTEQWGDMKSH